MLIAAVLIATAVFLRVAIFLTTNIAIAARKQDGTMTNIDVAFIMMLGLVLLVLLVLLELVMVMPRM